MSRSRVPVVVNEDPATGSLGGREFLAFDVGGRVRPGVSGLYADRQGACDRGRLVAHAGTKRTTTSGRTNEKNTRSATRSSSRSRHDLTRRYHRRMAFPDWLPLLITAILGSTGVTAVLARFAQLSGPARLRRRIQATDALVKELPPGQARHALELAIDRDAASLSSMSLVRPGRAADLISLVVYSIVSAVTLLIIFGYVILNTKDGEPFSELRKDVVSSGVPALISATVVYIILVAGALVILNKSLKFRRNTYADVIFAQGAVDESLIRAMITNRDTDGNLIKWTNTNKRRHQHERGKRAEDDMREASIPEPGDAPDTTSKPLPMS